MKLPTDPLRKPTPEFQTEAQAIEAVKRLRHRHQWEEAISLAECCLEQFPQSVLLHRLLAWTALVAHRTPVVIEQFTWLIALDPECDSHDYYSLAQAHRRNGDFESGRKVVEELVRLRPHSAGGHHILGMYLGDVGDTSGAILAYERAIELSSADNDDLWGYYHNLSNRYREVGRRDAALAALKQERVERSNRRRRLRKFLAELEQNNSAQGTEDGELRSG